MFKKLINWSQNNYTNLPWRKNRSVYTTLVSEIMLQQTTVGTVVNHFDNFIKKYPTIKHLAKTTEDEICISWKGLGYYRRARNLRLAAIYIVENFNGEIPKNYLDLVKIPGIGDYTASAIIAIGNNLPALAIDANLERVLSRIFGVKEEKGPKLISKLKELLNQDQFSSKKIKSFRDLNESFMDLGRTFCQAKKATCELCPMRENCYAFINGKIEELPVLKVAKKPLEKNLELVLLRVIVSKSSKILGYVKSEKEWLSGQVELPTYIISTADQKNHQYPRVDKKVLSKIKIENLPSIKTTITKYKIQNLILRMSPSEFKKVFGDSSFTFYENSSKSNFSTATIKVLNS